MVGSGYGDQFVVAAVFVWVIFSAEPWYQFREGLICWRHMSADLNVTLSPLSRGNPFLPEQVAQPALQKYGSAPLPCLAGQSF